jgi:SAM-dependent methyltransferase
MPLMPDWLTTVRNEVIIGPIESDPRTVNNPGTFLGWQKNTIFNQVIEFGQADFEASIGHLSPQDRAVLYARYNQPRHLDELVFAFKQLFESTDNIGRPTFIDLGCGPFTAGLAFAVAYSADKTFRYYGVDRAEAMLDLSNRLFKAAQTNGGIHADTSAWFGSALTKANFGKITGALSIVVASYLLASPSLDVNQLVLEVVGALKRIGPGPAAVFYTNSALPDLNHKFPAFREAFEQAGFTCLRDSTSLFTDTKTPKELRYDQTTNPLTASLREIRNAGLPEPIRLQANHRNTEEIALVAEHFHCSAILPPATVQRGRNGDTPRLVSISTWNEFVIIVATRYKNQAGSIGVIVCRVEDAKNLCEQLKRALPAPIRVDMYTNKTPKGDENNIQTLARGITILTGESAIGLEFDTVFLQDLHRSLPCQTVEQSRRMYMLCARARNSLILINGPTALAPNQIAALPHPNYLNR